MEIIITKRFEKEYIKKLLKYFHQNELILVLKTKQHKFISLHDPFFKFKNKINSTDFRWVIAFVDWKSVIPLFIFLKKDKKYWENVSWENHQKLIETEFNLATQDVQNGDYEIF